MDVKIESSWKQELAGEFRQPYFKDITIFLKTERELGKVIYPPGNLIFNAFEKTTFDKVKVVLLGQDPYHGQGQAHGLSFSVPDGAPPPPSLVNIFKELKTDVGMEIPKTGNLTPWAEQGVLLLNAYLTVRAAEPASHSKIGWGTFTDAIIRKVSEDKSNVVFMLWGKFAAEKEALIDQSKHLVLKAPHPSPFSVERGFYGSRHFSKTNEYLVSKGKDPINWKL